MEKQTAVEWLEQRFNDPYNNKPFITKEDFKQAKQIEKEQIIEACNYGCSDWGSRKDAEQYYNKTYEQ